MHGKKPTVSSIDGNTMKHTVHLMLALFSCTTTYTAPFNQLFDAANQLFISGNLEDAIKAYAHLLPTYGNKPQVSFNLATAYFHARKHDDALGYYLRTIELDPTHLKALCQLGKLYKNKNNINSSIAAYQQALKLDPGCLAAAVPLARIYEDREQFNEAFTILHAAAELHPDHPVLMLDLINVLIMLNHDADALAWSLRLLNLYPNSTDALYSTAYIYKKISMLDEAMIYYKRIFDIDPQHVEAQFSYALALLITGNKNPKHWADGWHYYETRWKREHQVSMRHYPQPMWDGSDPTGKTIFLWAEQGLGDTFEFMRYAKVLKDRGAARVIMAVQNPLRTIAQLCPYIDEVIGQHDKQPHFDYHAPLLSLPYLTKTTLDTVPHEIPYLYAHPELERNWKDTLAEDHNFKIGICWQGNPNYASPFLRRAVAGKSMSVTQFVPIMEIPGVSVYSLQKISGTDQINEIPQHLPFYVFDENFDQASGRFMDTAAVIKQLDLVITIDTAICHFAGALGVPVWNLLPEPPDWRWMLYCDDTPWYPNMRLFRQPTSGNWDEVIQEVVVELTAYLAGEKPLIYFKNSYAQHLDTKLSTKG